jgi:transposase InsO family protein
LLIFFNSGGSNFGCKEGSFFGCKKHALKKFNIPKKNQLIIRSDNGPQMTSKVFMNHIECLGEKQILHELIPVRTSNKNAHIEAFNSILEIEFFQPRYFNSNGQAYKEVVDFINFYNYRRVHSSLGMKTPMEVYNSYKMKEELKISPVKV